MQHEFIKIKLHPTTKKRFPKKPLKVCVICQSQRGKAPRVNSNLIRTLIRTTKPETFVLMQKQSLITLVKSGEIRGVFVFYFFIELQDTILITKDSKSSYQH